MISVNANKLLASLKELERRKGKILKAADAGYRQRLYDLITLAAQVSPQFSGQFASNWAFSVDGNMPVFKSWPGKFSQGASRKEDSAGNVSYRTAAHRAGDPEAVRSALARGAAFLQKVTLKSRVHLVNTTDMWTDGTKMHSPGETETLRPENIIPGRVRIESYLRARAKHMTPTSWHPLGSN